MEKISPFRMDQDPVRPVGTFFPIMTAVLYIIPYLPSNNCCFSDMCSTLVMTPMEIILKMHFLSMIQGPVMSLSCSLRKLF